MKNIVIIGAGDLGKEIVWLIEDINRIKPTYLISGFLDDDEQKHGKEFCWYKVLGGLDRLEEISNKMQLYAVVAVKDSTVRKRIVEEHPSFTHWETIMHPRATVAGSSSVGEGSILFPNVTVSVDSKLGRFGIYYIQSTVGNDCVIGDFVTALYSAAVLEHSKIADGVLLPVGTCVQPFGKVECDQAGGSPEKGEPAAKEY